MGTPVTPATVDESAVYQTATQLPPIMLAFAAPFDNEGNKSARLIAKSSTASVTPAFGAPAVPVPLVDVHLIVLPVLNAVVSDTVTVHVPLETSISTVVVAVPFRGP